MELGPVVSTCAGAVIPVMCDGDVGPLCGLLHRDPDLHTGDVPGASCPAACCFVVDVCSSEMLAINPSVDGTLSVVEHTPRNGMSHDEYFVSRTAPPTV